MNDDIKLQNYIDTLTEWINKRDYTKATEALADFLQIEYARGYEIGYYNGSDDVGYDSMGEDN